MDMQDRTSIALRVLRSATTAVPFVIVVLAPALASWHGLVAMGREWLGLGSWAPLVPLVLDAAALYAAALAWRATLAGDAAGVDRLLVWVYAGISAGLNIWHADAVGGLPAAIFYGVASLSAALIWERTLRAIRRRELRAIGAVDAPAPRFRVLRWLLHSEETWATFKLAIGEGVSSASQAVALYRAQKAGDVSGDGEQPRDVPAPSPSSPRASLTTGEASTRQERPVVAAERAPELVGLSQRQAVRRAFLELDSLDVPELRAWLADRGVKTDRSRAYRYVADLKADVEADAEAEQTEARTEGRRLAAVAGGER